MCKTTLQKLKHFYRAGEKLTTLEYVFTFQETQLHYHDTLTTPPKKIIFKETTKRETLLQAPKRFTRLPLPACENDNTQEKVDTYFLSTECVKTKSKPGRHSVSCLTVSEPLFAYQNTGANAQTAPVRLPRASTPAATSDGSFANEPVLRAGSLK